MITGPIAPPTILIIFVAAEDIPVYSLGVNEMIVLVNMTGKSAPAIPNKKRQPATDLGVAWNNRSNKNEIVMITMPGTINFKLKPFLNARSPNIGPKIIAARPKGNCRKPTFSGSSPSPDGSGAGS